MAFILMIFTWLSLSLAVCGLPSVITPDSILSFSNTNTTSANLGVLICTGIESTGQCFHSVWLGNICIDLRGFAGQTLTFNPDSDIECFVMQGACNANKDYLDLTHDAPETCDLRSVPWRADMTSYTCWNASLF